MKTLLLPLFLLTFSVLFGQNNINVSNANFFEGEPYLSIDPNNNQHLVAAWMGFEIGNGIVIKTSYSDDGGVNWSTPGYFPHEINHTSSADVSLKYDSNNNLFICYIDYDKDNFTSGGIYIRKSIDGGINWTSPLEVINITDCPNQLCIDRPWMDISGNGNIFITSMNAGQPTLVTSPYHPFYTVSIDAGNSFSTPTILDGSGYLAGDAIPQPMPSPTISSNGILYATYPSYVLTQNLFAQMILAKSTDNGLNFTHSIMYTGGNSVTDIYAKKGYLLISDPSDANHLALLTLQDVNGDADIFMGETFDGLNWSPLLRINQDPIGNGKMQDLVWGEFNENGVLAVCWRDRRNASTSGYQTETEIYAAIKFKDSVNFEQDFAISSQQVSHDVILEGNGNDFMNVQFIADTLYAVWGDVRTGTLNIFINKTNVNTGTSSLNEIFNEKGIITIYPNPASDEIAIQNFDKIKDIVLYDSKGGYIQKIENKKIGIQQLSIGEYLIIYTFEGKKFSAKFVKN